MSHCLEWAYYKMRMSFQQEKENEHVFDLESNGVIVMMMLIVMIHDDGDGGDENDR